MSEFGVATCPACKRRNKMVRHCKSRTCTWLTCPVCGASFAGSRWNQPHEFAGSLAAATAWARRFGVDVEFVEVGK